MTDAEFERTDFATAMQARQRYRIVRFYFRGSRRVLARGLTLTEAHAHCTDPETSSSTATGSTARRRTAARGPWFDGYEQE
jgi:hypothetical protein